MPAPSLVRIALTVLVWAAWGLAPPAVAASDRDTLPATTADFSVARAGQVVVGARRLEYRAVPGTLVIRDDHGRPEASVFYTAYIVPTAPGAPSRPVTFAFNGGPGGSSAFLHLNSVGPVRLRAHPAVGQSAVEPNPDTTLDRSDLIFVDAVGTGLSRRIDRTPASVFKGIDEDIDAFSRTILRWLEINGRLRSPVFLIGESYGGRRAAGLAKVLPDHGVDLRGIVLVSGGLSTAIRDPDNDLFYVKLLPTYAATAWYHHLAGPNPVPLESQMAAARAFADGAFAAALSEGSDLPAAERDRIGRRLSDLIGLPVSVVLAHDLRIDVGTYCKELLRGQRRLVGQLDTRATGLDPKLDSAEAEADPAWADQKARVDAGVSAYLFGDLHYPTDLPYRLFDAGAQQGWRWTRKGGGGFYPWNSPPITTDLAQAMTAHADMKLLALMGYYDLAVPYAITDYDLSHLHVAAAARKNIVVRRFRAGHSIFEDPVALPAAREALDSFYADALHQPPSGS